VKQPYFNFYVGDFVHEVSGLSLEATGLWIKMLCKMHSSPVRGTIKEEQALKLGDNRGFKAVRDILNELETAGVCDRDGDVLINRRMVRESEVSKTRSKVGTDGVAKRWQADSKRSSKTAANDIANPLQAGQQNDSKGHSKSIANGLAKPLQIPGNGNGSLSGEEEREEKPSSLDGFNEFITAWDPVGLQASPHDWDSTRELWRDLSVAQRVKAVQRLKLLRDYPEDPSRKSLPQSYLRREMWERGLIGRKEKQYAETPICSDPLADEVAR
jgi:uncharacterized protein YdaU (DUF1376 family)